MREPSEGPAHCRLEHADQLLRHPFGFPDSPCLHVPHDTIEGRRVQKVWTVAPTTNTILELGDRLVCQGVERVVREATGSYRRPFFHLLEARGPDCRLVNARDVKNVPGRPKTDKLDAVRLAKLAERGMVRASFVPPKPVRQLRDCTRTRTRTVFVQERTRHKHRVDKALRDAQIKLSGVVSDLFGMSGRAMLDALVAGERDPRALADLAKGNLVRSRCLFDLEWWRSNADSRSGDPAVARA
ncbi:IS110 family transposase [Streptomyces ipomoeae]|uniref:IS110 family transposase n=2 Tax=Streptomyces ipomoeae TaxID=103232 RepID=UPI0015F0C854|nr:transposase [Streptomyces ipomoeae]